jgi:hypothetical protein
MERIVTFGLLKQLLRFIVQGRSVVVQHTDA